MATVHDDKMPFKTFNQNSHLRRHITSVHERKTQFKCGICDKKYEGKRALTVHVRTIHEGKKVIKCDICDKKYSTEKHLKRHIATIHTDENQ